MTVALLSICFFVRRVDPRLLHEVEVLDGVSVNALGTSVDNLPRIDP